MATGPVSRNSINNEAKKASLRKLRLLAIRPVMTEPPRPLLNFTDNGNIPEHAAFVKKNFSVRFFIIAIDIFYLLCYIIQHKINSRFLRARI
jgi:hypothetical protein